MECSICNKEIILKPSASERARKYGSKPRDYTELFPVRLRKLTALSGGIPREHCYAHQDSQIGK